MNIAVVDDEEIIRQQIHGFIKKKPEFSISDFAAGEELLAAKADFDIIFLDIQIEGIEAYAAMDELEGQLWGGFYRCHRGYLVNMAHIVRYDKRPAGAETAGGIPRNG